MLLADYGATVLRIDRPNPNPTATAVPTQDTLTRHKSSLPLSLKTPTGRNLFLHLIERADILLDPYRPQVLERLDLSPKTLHALNPRLIIARLTGFRRDGPYRDMAGHDINYLAVSGVLALLGRKGERPYAPGNLLGDFAAGGAGCFMGILMALFARDRDRGRGLAGGGNGRGRQIVEANMVDGVAHLASMPRFAMQTPLWDQERGANVLDGGCPWYDTYETADGGFMAVGCLEEQFYRAFAKGLGFGDGQLPHRLDRANWPRLKQMFAAKFRSKTRAEWEDIFDGTDACVTPVLSFRELKTRGFKMRPMVDLNASPGLAVSASLDHDDASETGTEYRRGQGDGVRGEGFISDGLVPGAGAEAALRSWLGFERGREYDVVDGGFVSLAKRGGGVKANL